MLATLACLALIAPAASAASPVDRLAGENRVATSVKVARAGWDQSDHVLLATAVDYPDAVSAAALSSSLQAPVLLTMPDGLSPEVASAIDDLGASTVTLLGGPAALSRPSPTRPVTAASRSVASPAPTATRPPRRSSPRSRPVNDVTRVAVALGNRADGRDAWPDALSAASLAGGDEIVPTLLADRRSLPDATRAMLRQLAPDTALVLGGDSAVSNEVTEAVSRIVPEVSRVRGPDRYETALQVAEVAMRNAASDQAIFVSGEDFADALSAGALAARMSAPLLLVPAALLDDDVDAYLRSDASPFQRAKLIGGDKAVTEHVETELVAAMTGEPRPAPPPPRTGVPRQLVAGLPVHLPPLDLHLGAPRPVRVRRQLGHQHRQRLLRRAAVLARLVAGRRWLRLPPPELQVGADPPRRDPPVPSGLGRLAGLLTQARAALATPRTTTRAPTASVGALAVGRSAWATVSGGSPRVGR